MNLEKDLKVCTISKFPPYMSGHSFESLYQGQALYEMTGQKHYELTYHADVYDKRTNYNDSSELENLCNKYLNVYRVKPNSSNVKVFDGALLQAFLGTTINLVEEKDINVISTFYLDPHAAIANQAKIYAERVLNKEVIVAHKAVGSDVLNSIANHIEDGQAKYLISQMLQGDLMYAVSQYTKDKLVEYSAHVMPQHLVEKLSSEVAVLYAPFDTHYFEVVSVAEQASFRKRFGIKENHRIISYFGRVFPEKGIEDLLVAYDNIKGNYSDTTLVIGGFGTVWEDMRALANKLGTPDVIFTGAVSNEDKRALMQLSEFGVIPTKPVANFVETLCICALEYQAAKTPLLTTAVGGVPEAAGSHSLYAKHSDPTDLAQKMEYMLNLGPSREKKVQQGLAHIQKFNYYKITSQFVEDIANVWEQTNKPLGISSYLSLNKGVEMFSNVFRR